MPAALQSILALVLVPVAAIGRFIRPAAGRGAKPAAVDPIYLARVKRAEAEGDETYLAAELARLQPTADSLRRTTRPSPTAAEWPDEDLNALFGPDVATTTDAK